MYLSTHRSVGTEPFITYKSTGSAPKHNFILVDTCQYQYTTQRDCARSVDGEAGDGAEILGSAIPGQDIHLIYVLGME